MASGTALSKEDLWGLVIGGSILSTGGGIGPTRYQFDAVADEAFATVRNRLWSIPET